jgi:hypothetical protein
MSAALPTPVAVVLLVVAGAMIAAGVVLMASAIWLAVIEGRA